MPFIACNDVCLYFELRGPEGAPVLVLNNGILMNAAASWAAQAEAFSQEYRLLLYDCRGQGQSDHPEGPTRWSSTRTTWRRCSTGCASTAPTGDAS